MRTVVALLSFLLAAAVLGTSIAQPPDHFELLQNDPDPFCPAGDVGATDIRLALPVASAIQLEVWSPDTSAVVRTLIHAFLPAGYHSITWDGTDGGGSDLASGAYPYSMTANDPDSGDSLFYDMLTATIDCEVATRPGTWGGIKAEFRKE